jgi:site-specific DNA-cytosine methylase
VASRPQLRAMSLCAGVGAADLGLAGHARTVVYVEREIYAAAVLAARMEEGALDAGPIWSDLFTFDARAWRGAVDLVVSGIPCQPYSVAGKRKGNADERALWPELVRVVAECEPRFVFIENVPAFLAYAGPLFDALRGLGFQWRPPLVLSAAEIGAPCWRPRLFLLAQRAVNADGDGPTGVAGDADNVAARADSGRQHGEWGGWVFDIERQTLRHDADGCDLRCRTFGSPWEAESANVKLDYGAARRLGRSPVDELRAIGNAVHPQLYRLAWEALMP